MKRWFFLFLVLTCVAAACKKDQNPGYKGTTRVAIDIIVDHLSVE